MKQFVHLSLSGSRNPISESNILKVLLLFAILRISFFSASFPFFNNVDEPSHVDLVVKYSHAKLPTPATSKMEHESARLFVLYGTPEYLQPPQPKLEPFWKQLQKDDKINLINNKIVRWMEIENHESLSPPFYYTVWGIWHNLGKILGLDKYSLYWLKILNIFVYAGIMLTAYQLAKMLVPGDVRFRISVLMLLAVFPQDVFYSINSDVPSAMIVALSWLMLINVGYRHCSRKYIWLTGVVISLAVLTKLSNLPLLVFSLIFCGWIIFQWHRQSILRKRWYWLIELGLCSILPIFLWCIYNYFIVGDIFATSGKIEYLGWKVKDPSQILHHPIFSLSGINIFFENTLLSFWRGEFTWHLKHMLSPWMDHFYTTSSFMFFASSPLIFYKASKENRDRYYFLLCCSFLLIIGYFAFLALISVIYNYGKCWYPSESYPYMTSGRLIIGVLVPFVFIYIIGLQSILKLLHLDRFLLLVVGCISIAIMLNEVVLTMPAIKSKFNFFGLIYL